MTDHNDECVIIVVRVIRSFPHRNIRNIVLKEVNLDMTTEEILEKAKQEVCDSSNLPPPFR